MTNFPLKRFTLPPLDLNIAVSFLFTSFALWLGWQPRLGEVITG